MTLRAEQNKRAGSTQRASESTEMPFSSGNWATFYFMVAEVKANSCKARKQNMVWKDLLDIQSNQRNILEEIGAGGARVLFLCSNL